MKIDVDYLKKILDKFIDSETQYIDTDIFGFLAMSEGEKEKFMLHWDVLLDKGLIVKSNGSLSVFYEHSLSGELTIWNTEARLHDLGHTYYLVLEEDEFRNKVKKGFKNISIDVLFQLMEKYIAKKIDNLV